MSDELPPVDELEELREWCEAEDLPESKEAVEKAIELKQSQSETELSATAARNATVQPTQTDDPHIVHGVAIGVGDVTDGKNGRKKWPAETLERAADSLEGRPLVRDHINSVLGNVGTVTEAKFKDDVGVLFEAELDDEELAKKVERGRLEVSARIKHQATEDLPKDDETGARVVMPPAVFANLSLVNSGASESNVVKLGEADDLGEVASEFESDNDDKPSVGELKEQLAWYQDKGWTGAAEQVRKRLTERQQ